MEKSTIQFTKMHGAGNDYIYVNTLLYKIMDPAKASIEWSKPHFGIGSDGLILIGEATEPDADFSMRIFNNDGSEAMMCGNGTRCVAKFLHDKGLTDKNPIRLQTLSGIKVLNLHLNADNKVETVTVDMGEPILKQPAQFGVHGGGRFTRYAPNTQGIRTVREDLVVDHMIHEAKNLPHVRAQGIVFLENQDARVADAGIQFHRNAHFGAGAQHAIAVHAAHFALLDGAAGQLRADHGHCHQLARRHVRGPADDLEGFARSHIHGAYVEMVAVFMRHAGQHAADHHVFQLFAQVVDALDTRAGHDHALLVLRWRNGDRSVALQQIHRYFHLLSPP